MGAGEAKNMRAHEKRETEKKRKYVLWERKQESERKATKCHQK